MSAKKSSRSTTSSQARKAVRTAKKLYKLNPKAVAVIVTLIVLAAIVVGVTYVVRPDLFGPDMPTSTGSLVVHFIDVGQGDAIYVQFPSGKDMLIDAGTTENSSSDKLFVDGTVSTATGAQKIIDYIKHYNTDTSIDYLFITHPDLDHISFADEVLEEYQVNAVYLPYVDIDGFDTTATAVEKAEFDGGASGSATYGRLVADAFNEPNCTVKCSVGNYTIEIEADITFNVYGLEKDECSASMEVNGLSPICLLTYAQRTIVFTGDATAAPQNDYMDETLMTDCDVLKVAHHGSETNGSNSQQFLDDVGVEYAVISVGADNSYELPDSDVIGRLEEYCGNNVYRTDINGTCVLTVDNKGNMNFKSAVALAA